MFKALTSRVLNFYDLRRVTLGSFGEVVSSSECAAHRELIAGTLDVDLNTYQPTWTLDLNTGNSYWPYETPKQNIIKTTGWLVGLGKT